MSKLTRQQKKEEERRIIAEMDEAMQALHSQDEKADITQTTPSKAKEKGGYGNDPTPQILHCKRCKTQMENGVCPTCGYKTYVPMDEARRKKIRWIVTGVCLVGFLVLFILLRIGK